MIRRRFQKSTLRFPATSERLSGVAEVKDPERRYQAAKDIRNELEDLKRELESGETTEGVPNGHRIAYWHFRHFSEALDKAYEMSYDASRGSWMKTITVSKARETLYRLLDEAASSHEPIQITGMRNNVVMISEEDWNSVQETLYLLSIPGMRESIREGMETPLEETSEEPGW